MYTQYYQFTQKPFGVTPDPKFLYMSGDHQESLASIIYGIRERKGFIAVIGEVGTGKTTLLNAAIEELNKQIKYVFIFNTDVNFNELLMTILIELGLAKADQNLPKYTALGLLNQYATEEFAAGGNIAVFIDEAQNLDSRTMENLRLLSNLETTKYKLIQIVLAGQPELALKLRERELRQLAQRINLRRYINPLSKKDTFHYIRHHLRVAGYTGEKLFTDASLKKIWKYSKGVPRKINLLCDNALLLGYGLGKREISISIVKEAIRDLNWGLFDKYLKTMQKKQSIHLPKSSGKLTGLAYASIVLLLGFFLGAGIFRNWIFDGGLAERSSPSIGEIGMAAQTTGPQNEYKPGLEIEKKWGHRAELPFMRVTDAATRNFSGDFDANPSNSQTIGGFKNIVVRSGDTLSGITQATYGEYYYMLPRVIRANPRIANPDLILPGQVIRLPKVNSNMSMKPITQTVNPASRTH